MQELGPACLISIRTRSGRTRPQGTCKNVCTWFDTAESVVCSRSDLQGGAAGFISQIP